jgi:methyltransferase (TIGR00027 family)
MMNEVREVTGTAFVVAEFRARENAEAHPLYLDPVVPIFLDESTRAAADAISDGFPAAATNVRIRTRYFDDRLDERLADGCRQVVILGAGLDTRAQRTRAGDAAYFEIDDARTLRLKQTRLTENNIAADVTFIPGDYVADGVLRLLEANGFKRDLPSFFIWEGNTMYLTKPTVMEVLRALKENVPAFALSFDFMDEAVVTRTTGDPQVTTFVERFAAMGAPWHLGIDNLPALAEEAGLAIADVTTVAELHRAHWPDRHLDSVMYEHYSLCTLKPAFAGAFRTRS